MSRIFVRSERIIDARPADVYETIADYKEKRPRMLTPNFLAYTVEKGGHGAGTEVSYRLHVANRERSYRMQVEETVKGQVIAEKDSNSSLVTRWTVLPMSAGERSRVSVESEWEGAHGVGGFFERTFAPLGLRKIYNEMLSLL
ncbi:MAG TPA: SRPBCC family protein, partial [Ktedonobacteraceae bacterium]